MRLLDAVLLLAPLAACRTTQDLAATRAELIDLHDAQRRVHLAEDAAGFAALLDDDFHELRDGRVLHPTRAEKEERFKAYFAAVEFLAWDDLEEPLFHIAEDGSLATVSVRKLVRTREEHEGEPCVTRTVFAWMSTCVRRPEGWRIAAVASTRAENNAATSLAALRHALGGEERLAALGDLHAEYACRGPIGSYRLALELPREGAWRIAWTFPNQPTSVFELDGQAGWLRAADGARSPLPPAEVEMVRAHAFPRLVADPEGFLGTLTRVGTRSEDGHTLERLESTAGNALELDLATDLPARIELLDARTDPPARVTLRFERWTTLDGLLVPELVVAVDARGEWSMELDARGLQPAAN
jgi:hypothetical protein